jgi:DNA-binding beta-propeller fold protein YncE
MRRRLPMALAALIFLTVAVALVRKPFKRAFLETPKTVSTGRFQDPEGMCVDPAGNIWIADEDLSKIFVLDKNGKTLVVCDSLPGIERVTGGDSIVAVGPGHVVAIGDHCLLELKLAGDRLELVRQYGRRGHGEGEFEDPEGVARDPSNGDIYATDEDHRRVLVFDREGKYLRKIPVEHDPEGIFVFEDRVYVTMSKAGWVGCYGRDGTPRFRFGRKELVEPDSVVVSPERKVYVTDQRANRVQVFDLDGKFLFTIGRPGRGPGEFDQPEDLCIDAEGNLWVADGGNHRIQVFTKDGTFLRLIE